ncbi:MAG: FAD-dependent oxidoreductase [Caldilineales bacterium]
MSTRYLLVGSGVAAIAAAEAIRSLDAAGAITLISDDPHGYYSRPGLAYYLTGELPRAALFPWNEQDFARLRLQRLQARVAAVEPEAHRLLLSDGAVLPYDRLLLATGAAALQPDLPGNHLPEVVKLDSLADAERMIKLAKRARSAVVVGGGITALEIVEGLHPYCRHVHYLLRGARYWSNVLDEEEARTVLARLAAAGVQIHTHSEITQIEERQGHVAAVRLQKGERIACDLVAVAIGVVPRLELARAAGLQVDRGILADDTLRTSAADVFAAGDVAQVLDSRSGRATLDTLWNTARAHGEVAGRNMAGAAARYLKPVPFNVTRLAGITTTVIGAVGAGRDADVQGIARGDSDIWRSRGDALVVEDGETVNRLRLVVGPQHLLGAVLMGDQRLSRTLQHLIGTAADITPIRELFTQPGVNLYNVLAEFAQSRMVEP